MRLDGKRAVVTGGARGIGAAIARRFAEAGAVLLLADLDLAAAEAAAATLGPGHGAAMVDVADEGSVEAMIGAAGDRLGGLDVLVHCAAIAERAEFLSLTLEAWRRTIDINLTGTFLVCRAAARVMAAGGSLITLASAAAVRPSYANSAYATSKAGLVTLTRGIALDLAPRGIRANVIAPGPTDTEMTQRFHAPAVRARLTERIPLRRYAGPEEITGAALYLASDDASFVTGAVLAVDGGYSFAGVLAPDEPVRQEAR